MNVNNLYTGWSFESHSWILVGYRTVAVNQVIADSSLEPKKKKKKGEPRDAIDIVPSPIEVKSIEVFLSTESNFNCFQTTEYE